MLNTTSSLRHKFVTLFVGYTLAACTNVSLAQTTLYEREWFLQSPEAMADGYQAKYISRDLKQGKTYEVTMEKTVIKAPFSSLEGKGKPRVVVYQGGWNGTKLATRVADTDTASYEFQAAVSGSHLFVFTRDVRGELPYRHNYHFKGSVKQVESNSQPTQPKANPYDRTLDRLSGYQKKGRYYNYFTRRMEAGKSYTITVESPNMIPVVLIRKNFNTQTVWVVDANPAKGRKAQIVFTPSETKDYQIEVTAQGFGTQGSYRIDFE